MSKETRCPRCGSPLESSSASCPHCLLATAGKPPSTIKLGPGFLDDLPMPSDQLVIADKYTVIETIARGGMGVVYKARQENLNRIVAVKMLLGGAHAGDDYKRRFLQEAKAAAQLKHPNIVSIHDWGDDRGQPFFSMDFIEGQTLAEMARRHPLSSSAAAEITRTLAQAMQYAHSQGVLHRDLKPSNVLVDVAGVPHISDFGLARQLNSEAMLTVSGDVLGTPGYLPPEQAAAKRELIGPHSDVYGLGAILYYLLTSQPPHSADSVGEALRAVEEKEPIPPRQLNASVDAVLEAICLKCLAKDPAFRYPTASALAADLERWQQGLPVRIGAWSPAQSIRYLRNHPWRAAFSGAFALWAVLAIAAQWFGLRIFYWEMLPRVAFFNGLEPYWRPSTIAFSSLLVAAAVVGLLCGWRRRRYNPVPLFSGLALVVSMLGVVMFRAAASPLHAARNLPGFSGYVRFQTNGTMLATFNTGAIRSFKPDLTEAESPLKSAALGAQRIAISPTGDRCAVVTSAGAVQLIELPSGRLIQSLSVPGWPAQAGAFSPDGRALAVLVSAIYDKVKERLQAPPDGSLTLYSAVDGSKISVEPTPLVTGYWQALDWKGEIIAIADGYEDARRGTLLWEVAAHRVLHFLQHPEHQSGPLSVALSPDARLLAVGYGPYDVGLWDVRTGELLRTLPSRNNWVVAVEFSPDGKTLASGEGDSAVRLWDVATGKALRVFGMGSQNSSDYCYSVSFDPSGQLLACGSQRSAAVVWRVK